ncbi:PREDICTED: protein DEK-like [Priapulus caudatus]|uniref:Protein DEK-like n=1 Tax=Priapulus caudatus TaxID=37621 RepID=A0ABM1DPZ9_PRICU|nr:PREDICTED: protein DEK-like [Priapulus caudatus]
MAKPKAASFSEEELATNKMQTNLTNEGADSSDEGHSTDDAGGGGDNKETKHETEDTPTQKSPKKSPQKSPKKKRALIESDEEEEEPLKTTPKKQTSKKSSPIKKPASDGDGEASPQKAMPATKDISSENEDQDVETEKDEKHLALYDQPTELSGKRVRKKTERLVFTAPPLSSEKPTLEIPEGKGEKLGECERINHFLSKTRADDLKPLHVLLYDRVGKVTVVKRDIRLFCGFAFSHKDPEYAKKSERLNRLNMGALRKLCEVLDLDRKGTKEEVVEKIMTFLLMPNDNGRKVPVSKRAKAMRKKRKRASSKGSSPNKRPKKNTSDKEDEERDDDSGENLDGSEDGEEEEEEEEEEEKSEKKKPTKTKTASKPKESKGKESKKKQRKVKVVLSESEESSDDEPLAAKVKKPPTNDEVKEAIKNILEGANLEEVTMKSVCKEVYAKYPDFDLSDRKDFIKVAVKKIIS